MPDPAKLSDFAFVNPRTDTNGASADAPVAFIPMASVAEGGGWASTETRPLADGRKGYTLFQRGDVIVAKITPCFENGKVALLSDLDTEYGLGSTEFHVLRAKSGHDPRFVYHWTRHPAFLRAGEASMTGSAGQRRVPADFFERFEVTKIQGPPQGLIADILDAIDDAIIETDALIEKLEATRLGLVDDLVTRGLNADGRTSLDEELREIDGGRAPEGWTIGPLSVWHGHGFTIQIGPFGTQLHADEYVTSGIPVVMPQDIRTPKIVAENIAHIEPNRAAQLPRHHLREGDLVLSRRGELDRVAIIERHQVGWICGTGCLRVRCEPGVLYSHWLAYLYSSRATQRQLKQIVVGSTMLNMNSAAFGKLVVAVPPIEEQEEIGSRIQAFDEQITARRIERDKLASLRIGLRDDLLTGRKPVVAIREAAE